MAAGEIEIAAAATDHRAHRFRPAAVPGADQFRLEKFEAVARDFGQQSGAVAEMPVRRGRADADRAGDFREAEAGRAALGDQVERGVDQRLAQVAVVVALAARLAGPAHRGGAGEGHMV